jgi:hypothetical protein
MDSPCKGTGLVDGQLCPRCGGRPESAPSCAAASAARTLRTAAQPQAAPPAPKLEPWQEEIEHILRDHGMA